MPGAQAPVLRTPQARELAKTLPRLQLRFRTASYSAGYWLEPEKPPQGTFPDPRSAPPVVFRCSRNRIAQLLLVLEERGNSEKVC
jgi:hypothetical protein